MLAVLSINQHDLLLLRATTGVMIAMLSLYSVHPITVIAAAIRRPSWNLMMDSSTLCK